MPLNDIETGSNFCQLLVAITCMTSHLLCSKTQSSSHHQSGTHHRSSTTQGVVLTNASRGTVVLDTISNLRASASTCLSKATKTLPTTASKTGFLPQATQILALIKTWDKKRITATIRSLAVKSTRITRCMARARPNAWAFSNHPRKNTCTPVSKRVNAIIITKHTMKIKCCSKGHPAVLRSVHAKNIQDNQAPRKWLLS